MAVAEPSISKGGRRTTRCRGRLQSTLVVLSALLSLALGPGPALCRPGNLQHAAQGEQKDHAFVHDLTEADFNATLAAQTTPHALIEFYASWCPACQHFMPHYEKIARLFNGPGAPYPNLIYVARVDCYKQGNLCVQFGIGAYPTMLFGEPGEFAKAPRDGGAGAAGGLAKVGRAFTAEALATWLEAKLSRKVDLEAERRDGAAGKALQGGGGSNDDGASLAAGLVSKHAHTAASVHDMEEATAVAFQFIFSAVVLEAPAREAMVRTLELLRAHHPSPRCRVGSGELAARLDAWWPVAGGGGGRPNRTALQTFPVCGPAFPSKHWADCKGSLPSARGYSCGLWSLFHALSVRVPDSEARGFPAAMRSFVEHFFGCEECRSHFLEMTAGWESENIATRQGAALWLWRMHNKVNERLEKEERESRGAKGDPAFPKQQWPPEQLCPPSQCRHGDAAAPGPWNEDSVFRFLEAYYGASGAAGGAAGGASLDDGGGGGGGGVAGQTLGLARGALASKAAAVGRAAHGAVDKAGAAMESRMAARSPNLSSVSYVFLIALVGLGGAGVAQWWRQRHRRRK